MDLEKINKNGLEIKEAINMAGSPVAIKLVKPGENIPEGYEKPDEKVRHCQYVADASRDGKMYVTSLEDHLCKGGAAALGLGALSEKLRSGEFYFSRLGHFKTLEAAKKTIDNIAFLPANSVKKVLYAPLEKANFEPDVIIFLCNPKQAMVLTQSLLYTEGGKMSPEFSGKQSICSDAVARVITNDAPNITVGCSGSRKYAKIDDSKMILSIPGKNLNDLMEGLAVFAK